MHLTDIWKALKQKDQEKILRENNYDSLHKPKGYEIDRMLKNTDLNKLSNAKIEKEIRDFGITDFEATDFGSFEYGPGDIPW